MPATCSIRTRSPRKIAAKASAKTGASVITSMLTRGPMFTKAEKSSWSPIARPRMPLIPRSIHWRESSSGTGVPERSSRMAPSSTTASVDRAMLTVDEPTSRPAAVNDMDETTQRAAVENAATSPRCVWNQGGMEAWAARTRRQRRRARASGASFPAGSGSWIIDCVRRTSPELARRW